MKPIRLIKINDGETFWNCNDGTENYSRDIIKLLEYINQHTKVLYEVE